MKISLTKWAEKNFDPVPHRNTLCKWRAEGKISPTPVFIGRTYYVEENARFVGGEKSAPARPDLTREHGERSKRKGGKPTLLDRLEADEAKRRGK